MLPVKKNPFGILHKKPRSKQTLRNTKKETAAVRKKRITAVTYTVFSGVYIS